jgi:putative transposase
MNRRRTDFQALDVDAWPSVAYTEFGDKDRRAFQLRVNAVERYAQGESIGDIELATGVNRRQLYRLLESIPAPCRARRWRRNGDEVYRGTAAPR